jgi:hypothetical protein
VENLRERKCNIAVSTGQKWCALAKKVVQFLSEGRYVANAADGMVTFYVGK